jgi:hypothetical protein
MSGDGSGDGTLSAEGVGRLGARMGLFGSGLLAGLVDTIMRSKVTLSEASSRHTAALRALADAYDRYTAQDSLELERAARGELPFATIEEYQNSVRLVLALGEAIGEVQRTRDLYDQVRTRSMQVLVNVGAEAGQAEPSWSSCFAGVGSSSVETSVDQASTVIDSEFQQGVAEEDPSGLQDDLKI